MHLIKDYSIPPSEVVNVARMLCLMSRLLREWLTAPLMPHLIGIVLPLAQYFRVGTWWNDHRPLDGCPYKGKSFKEWVQEHKSELAARFQ